MSDPRARWQDFRARREASRPATMTDKERFFDDCLLDSAEDDIMGYRPNSVFDALNEYWARYGVARDLS
jgi:hypothetical protein